MGRVPICKSGYVKALDVARRGLVEGRGDDLPLHRPLHVGDFFRPLVDEQDDQVDLRMVVVMLFAMFCSSIVLPVRGGATIRPRWPLPIGVIRSMTRAEVVGRRLEPDALLRIEGVRFSKKILSRTRSGGSKLTASTSISALVLDGVLDVARGDETEVFEPYS